MGKPSPKTNCLYPNRSEPLLWPTRSKPPILSLQLPWDYRIVYEILKEDQIVLVLMMGKREGFYQALRRRLRAS